MLLELLQREPRSRRFDVDRLAAGHAGGPRGLRERRDHAQPKAGIVDHVRIAREDLEREHLQRVAHEDGRGLVEGAVTCRPLRGAGRRRP
jgi:hypothetical protein